MTRKAFLELLAALGLVSAVPLAGGCGDAASGTATATAFRLSRRGRRACNACKQHAQAKLFATEAAADENRAHPGCNCRIKPIGISSSAFARDFATAPVFDRRQSG